MVRPDNDPIVKLLLESARIDANTRDERGSTALHFAIKWGLVDIVRVLLEHGAQWMSSDFPGDTQLRAAVSCGDTKIIRFLVEDGANVNEHGYWGRTPLQIAAMMGCLEAAALLLDNGAISRLLRINCGAPCI
jgi:ankyrin repeat protein